MPKKLLADFEARMFELKDLSGVIGLLSWDQETFMPPKAGEPRAFQLSTMQGLYHERLVAKELGDGVAALESRTDLSADHKAMVRNVRWERDRAVKVPGRLVKELAEVQSRSVEAWRGARARKDYAAFKPHLENLVRLRREQADALGHGGERYDALLEAFEPGLRVSRLAPLLESLRGKLVPLVRAIVDSGKRPPNPLAGKTFELGRQWDFTVRLMKDMGSTSTPAARTARRTRSPAAAGTRSTCGSPPGCSPTTRSRAS